MSPCSPSTCVSTLADVRPARGAEPWDRDAVSGRSRTGWWWAEGRVVQPVAGGAANEGSGAGLAPPRRRHVSGECGGRLATPRPAAVDRRVMAPRRVPVPHGRWAARPAGLSPRCPDDGCQRGGGLRVWHVLPRVRRSDGCRRGGGARVWHACRPCCAGGGAKRAVGCASGRPAAPGALKPGAEGGGVARVWHACRPWCTGLGVAKRAVERAAGTCYHGCAGRTGAAGTVEPTSGTACFT